MDSCQSCKARDSNARCGLHCPDPQSSSTGTICLFFESHEALTYLLYVRWWWWRHLHPKRPNAFPYLPGNPFSSLVHLRQPLRECPFQEEAFEDANSANSLPPSLQQADCGVTEPCSRQSVAWKGTVLENQDPRQSRAGKKATETGGFLCHIVHSRLSGRRGPVEGLCLEARETALQMSTPPQQREPRGEQRHPRRHAGWELPCVLWLFMSCLIHDSPSGGRARKGTFISLPPSP